MKSSTILMPLLLLCSCSTTKYYIVRHAEKETAAVMTSDVPLSENGKQRAIALKDALLYQKIRHIFSTNFKRTVGTAQPLSNAIGISIQHYDAADSGFISLLKQVHGNTLVVGHSNTVDDLVNGLIGKKLLQDLADTAYGDLFIVTKHGKRYHFSKQRFGL